MTHCGDAPSDEALTDDPLLVEPEQRRGRDREDGERERGGHQARRRHRALAAHREQHAGEAERDAGREGQRGAHAEKRGGGAERNRGQGQTIVALAAHRPRACRLASSSRTRAAALASSASSSTTRACSASTWRSSRGGSATFATRSSSKAACSAEADVAATVGAESCGGDALGLLARGHQRFLSPSKAIDSSSRTTTRGSGGDDSCRSASATRSTMPICA